jgi:hypothetical protein
MWTLGGARGLLFGECVSEKVSMWARSRRHIPIIFQPCQLKYSLTYFNDIPKYTLTKIYSCHVNNNSHVIIATWICHMYTQQQCFCSIKCKYRNLLVGVPFVEAILFFLVHLLKIMPHGFRHVLCGRILFVTISIFCIAMSFVVVVMGNKLNIAVT